VLSLHSSCAFVSPKRVSAEKYLTQYGYWRLSSPAEAPLSRLIEQGSINLQNHGLSLFGAFLAKESLRLSHMRVWRHTKFAFRRIICTELEGSHIQIMRTCQTFSPSFCGALLNPSHQKERGSTDRTVCLVRSILYVNHGPSQHSDNGRAGAKHLFRSTLRRFTTTTQLLSSTLSPHHETIHSPPDCISSLCVLLSRILATIAQQHHQVWFH